MDHVTGHDHDHDHGGGHDHHHDHAHSDEFLEQLLTVGICGAFGIVAILLGSQAVANQSGMLTIMLAEPFWKWVLIGGVVLTLLCIIRGVALWRAAASPHVHDDDCGHDHAHGESHDHGGVFWRVVVLMFPLVLFFLGLPNQGFSSERIGNMVTTHDLDVSSLKNIEGRGDVSLTFNDISEAMRSPDRMEALTGTRATVHGMLKPETERQFTLYTTKMTCCAADMVPLKAKIVVQNDDSGGSLAASGYKPSEWLKVQGVLQFVKLPNSEQWLPVITTKLKDIERTDPE